MSEDLRKQAAATLLRREREGRQRAIDEEVERLRLAEEQRRLAEQQRRERETAVAEAHVTVPRYVQAVHGMIGKIVGLEDDFGLLRALRSEAIGAVEHARNLGATGLPDANPDVGPAMSYPDFLMTVAASFSGDTIAGWPRLVDQLRRERRDGELLRQAVRAEHPQEQERDGAAGNTGSDHT